MAANFEPKPIDLKAFEKSLPPPWPETNLRERIASRNAEAGLCVVALDDDPTGTQTVHGVHVLT